MQKKNYLQSKVCRSNQKELCYATTKQTLEWTKVSINPTWKEGLNKRQVNYFGMVKLTNKTRRNQHQQDSKLRQRSLTEADQKHNPTIIPSKEGGGRRANNKPYVSLKLDINLSWKEGLQK